MLKQFGFFVGFLVSFLFGASVSATSPVACTMEYAPVCGSVQVQCITTPCNPVKETFSNACVAKSRGAIDVVKGACEDASVTPPVVGGDSDAHGCKASAGYKWNPLAEQCLRPWESRVRNVMIAPVNDTCTDRNPKNCLQGKFGFQRGWFNFYGGIVGFDYIYGYTYRLRILETHTPDQKIVYSLLKVLSQK